MKRIIFDVESAGQFGNSLVYDLGFIITDNDKILSNHSWIISDVYYDMPEKMVTAYYAEKLPAYNDEIALGLRRVITMKDAYKEFATLCALHDVKEAWAYNCDFDVKALNNTLSICSDGFCDRFIPATVKTRCIMGAALSTICQTQKYAESAERTEKGNIRVNAECVYRYLSGKPEFDEAHTGLEDSLIEYEILLACLRRRKGMDTKPKGVTNFAAWRELQRKFA